MRRGRPARRGRDAERAVAATTTCPVRTGPPGPMDAAKRPQSGVALDHHVGSELERLALTQWKRRQSPLGVGHEILGAGAGVLERPGGGDPIAYRGRVLGRAHTARVDL